MWIINKKHFININWIWLIFAGLLSVAFWKKFASNLSWSCKCQWFPNFFLNWQAPFSELILKTVVVNDLLMIWLMCLMTLLLCSTIFQPFPFVLFFIVWIKINEFCSGHLLDETLNRMFCKSFIRWPENSVYNTTITTNKL